MGCSQALIVMLLETEIHSAYLMTLLSTNSYVQAIVLDLLMDMILISSASLARFVVSDVTIHQ